MNLNSHQFTFIFDFKPNAYFEICITCSSKYFFLSKPQSAAPTKNIHFLFYDKIYFHEIIKILSQNTGELT